tara:strand:+ start:2105 stop:2989 length:885 start_codon:yes stop_codon:yes gene_type:complete
MKKINKLKNILVLSAGGPAGIGFIKSIKKSKIKNVNIIAADCDPLSVGLFLADKHFIIPKLTEENSWLVIKKLIIENNINFILPCFEAGLLTLSKHINELKSLNVENFISSYNTINLCNNKFNFYQHLKDKFNMPKLLDRTFIKPDVGSGSRGIRTIEAGIGEHMWEYLPGIEYTIDVFCNTKSEPLATSVRTREGVKSGISVKGSVIRHKFLEQESQKLCKVLNIIGPCCIQWKEDLEGNPKLIECNPRLGGGTYFTTLAGINPAEIYLNNSISHCKYPNEIKVTRYFEEIVI